MKNRYQPALIALVLAVLLIAIGAATEGPFFLLLGFVSGIVGVVLWIVAAVRARSDVHTR